MIKGIQQPILLLIPIKKQKLRKTSLMNHPGAVHALPNRLTFFVLGLLCSPETCMLPYWARVHPLFVVR